MKVKAKKHFSMPRFGNVKPGDVIDPGSQLAKEMIQAGIAERVETAPLLQSDADSKLSASQPAAPASQEPKSEKPKKPRKKRAAKSSQSTARSRRSKDQT